MFKAKVFKIILIFIYIQFHYLKSENLQTLTLQYANSRQVSQRWDLDDINLIAPLKDMNNDFMQSESYILALTEDQNHITHEYLKNLITGNFINGSIHTYLSDYNYFIGSEKNITVPYDKNYEPFPTSLQYKVFKDNKDFFFIIMKNLHQKSLKDLMHTFLYAHSTKNPLSLFTFDSLDLTLTSNAQKLSVNSPFIMDFSILEKFDEETKNSITWVDLSNSILFNQDFDLSLLKETFPKLHKVSIKNTQITKIDENTINFLKQLQKESQISDSEPKNPFDNLDKDGMMIHYAAYNKINYENIEKNTVEEMKKYAYEINDFAFVLEVDGCLIENTEAFLALQNTDPSIRYKKAILIKGAKVKEPSRFKKRIAQLIQKKNQFFAWFLITALNLGFMATVFIKNHELIPRILLTSLYGLQSFIIVYGCLDDLLRSTLAIDTIGVIFKE